MSTRIQRLIIVALFGIGIVLLMTVLSDRSPQSAEPARIGVTREQLPAAPGEGQAPRKNMTPDAVGNAGETKIQRTDKVTGRLLQEFTWTKLTPHEQGVFDLVNPQATLYLKPSRVIRMRSDEGRFLAPDNYPQSGEFKHNLVVNIFESPEGTRPDLSDKSPDRVVRLKMDAATFDKTIGEVRSESPVDVYTPATGQVQFRGKGLKLIYNEVSGRVEYLEIAQGDSVRYNPDAAATPLGAATAGPAPGKGKAATAAPGSTAPAAGAKPDVRKDLQFYRILFERDVKIVSEGRTIHADQLLVYFTLNRAELAEARPPKAAPAKGEPAKSGAAIAPIILGRVVNLLPIIMAQALTETAPAAPPGAAGALDDMPAGPRDVVMTWQGKMVMLPVDNPPQEMSTPDDQYIRFEGSPVTVTDNDGRMVCRLMEYVKSKQTLTASGSTAFPLRISSPDLGQIGAPSLVVNVEKNTGHFTGPGYLRASDPAIDGPVPAGKKSSLPTGFAISWGQALDVTFAKKTGKNPVAGAGSLTQGGSIESAHFTGDVLVRDPKFSMKSATLDARFAPEAGAKGDKSRSAQLRSIDADGAVAVKFENGSLDASKLHIDTAPDKDGRFQPSRLIAEGNVKLVEPKRQISAGFLDAAIVPKAAAAGAAKPRPVAAAGAAPASPADKLSVDVGAITARQNVVMTLADGTVIRAENVDADNVAHWAVLTGAPVVITQGGDPAKNIPGNEFHVLKLRVDEIGDGRYKALGDGAGALTYTEVSKEGKPGRQTKVSWTHSMNYDGKANIVQVFGFVNADMQADPLSFNHLEANQMTLELIDPKLEAELIGPGSPTKRKDPIGSATGVSVGRLRRLVARDNVRLQAGTLVTAGRPEVVKRITITGPILVYRQVDQVAEVIGPGVMGVEDYSPTGKAPDQLQAIPLTGRGQTRFDWTKKMTMDGLRGDLAIEGGVKMTHLPQGSDQAVDLDADTLSADMEKMSSLDPNSLSGEKLTLNRVTAVGHVTLKDLQRLVDAHSMVYDRLTQTVQISAEPDRKIRFTRLSEGKSASAAKALWDIKTDTLKLDDVGF